MNALYQKWLILNVNQLFRHTSVALSTWAGVCFVDGKFQLKSLGIALITGAVIPTATAFFRTGIPQSEKDLASLEEENKN